MLLPALLLTRLMCLRPPGDQVPGNYNDDVDDDGDGDGDDDDDDDADVGYTIQHIAE